MKNGLFNKYSYLLIPSVIATLSSPIYASGYKMEFQSTSILAGNGEAAAVEDAGTNWYNSAGNVYLPQQAVFSAIDVYAPSVFTGTTTAPSLIPPQFGGTSFSATGSASSHPNTILPAMHYVLPFKDRFALGFSVVPAWGFKEDYGNDSILRYDLVKVYTKTFDIAPSLSYKINENWSIGAGPDFNYFSVQSEAHVRTESLAAPVLGTFQDSIQRFTGKQWKTGWHAGVLYRFNEDKTRIGLNYRSKIIMDLDGSSAFALRNIHNFETDDFSLRVPIPANTTLSIYHDVTPRVALLATVAYDQWGVLNSYEAKNVILPPSVPGGAPSLIPVNLEQNMHNAWNYSLGSHYKLNDKLMLRGSIKYEETPTDDNFRDVNFPDGPKLGFQIGSRYQMSQRVALDFVYGHVFVYQVPINYNNPVTFATSNGHQRTHIDLIGAQVVVNI